MPLVWDENEQAHVWRDVVDTGTGQVSTPKTMEELWQSTMIQDDAGQRWDQAKFSEAIGVPGAVMPLKNFLDGYEQTNKNNDDGAAAHGYTPEKVLQTMYVNPRVVDTPQGQIIVSDGPNPNFSGDWGDLGIMNKSHSNAMKKMLLSAGLAFGGGALLGGLGGAAAAPGSFSSSFAPTLTAETALAAGGGATGSGATGLAGLLGEGTVGGAAASLGGTVGGVFGPTAGLDAMIANTAAGGGLVTGGSGFGAGIAGITEAGLGLPSFDLGNLGTYTVDQAGNLVQSGVNLANSGGALEAGLGSVGTGVAAGAGAGAGAANTASTIAKAIKAATGIDVDSNLLDLITKAASTGIGMYGANQQSNELKAIADQARGDRLPALNAFNNALNNPNSWYGSAPAMGATDAILRKLSVGVGNPANNPGALAQAAAYNLGGYNDYLKTTGSLGLSGQAPTIAAQTNAANSGQGIYNVFQSGLADLTQPKQDDEYGSLAKLLKQGYKITPP